MTDGRTSHQMKYIDPCPGIPRAGKVAPSGDRAECCFQEVARPLTPPGVRRFRNSIQPELGATKVHQGKANDPNIAGTLVHGISTKSKFTVGSLLNPPQKSLYQEKLNALSESVYASSHKLLGRSNSAIPPGNNEETVYGMKTVKGLDIRELVNPSKTAEELEREAQEGHEDYLRSHNAYFAGEQIDRKYDPNYFNKDDSFGIAPNHYNDGRNLGKTLLWQGETVKFCNPNPAWKRCGTKEEMAAQLGQTIKVKKNTLNFPPGHTFGKRSLPDEYGGVYLKKKKKKRKITDWSFLCLSSNYSLSASCTGVGHLISTEPGQYVRGQDTPQSMVHGVRQHLKKVNFHLLPCLLQVFKNYDKAGEGRIPKEDVLAVCRQFHLDVSRRVLDELIDYCDTGNDGLIDFLEFTNLLNWKDNRPINIRERCFPTTELEPSTAPDNTEGEPLSESAQLPACEALCKLEEPEPIKPTKTLCRPKVTPECFMTSSSLIGSVSESATSNCRASGIPSVRCDLPAPHIKRVSDMNNYGDSSNVADLLYPSVNSQQGVHEKHLFCPRSREEIAEIFKNVCVKISEETFEEAWKLASMRHPAGEVSVEVFRDVLKEIKAI